ncbi:hypothetical protein HYH02_004427 [Chlamydomonas schloesseri]|uniref:Uncharacterized protein n=1 Tax=Chlamydomonas schloesseri TaxID=2026947 RepID=A0A835WNG5_9CHLO|nr:hypothetical protein HYH02_004427 [Chlamydomonas schloesseri]|eukprot:KAG2450587.1 hypothetical protein HYH02_004427 [Chlamydomonas schloesseri]
MTVPATAQPDLSVPDALMAMAKAVRSGEMMQARAIGEQCEVPLSLTAAELAMADKLSEGAESTVFRGSWRGQAVAVKKARIAASADLDRFKAELAILARLRHPAVVPLLGARCLPPDYMLVLPLAACGNLRDALHERGWRPSWTQLLGLARQVAAGMQHVHGAGVLHRDIKPANMLLADPLPAAGDGDTVPRVQIADFGLAVELEEDGVSGGAGGGYDAQSIRNTGKPTGGFYKRQMVGTLEYMGPELLLRTAPPSRASDVYAWAVLVNEMATGTIPFSDCTKDNPEVHTVLEMGYGRQELAAAVCAEGLRPLLPRACPPGFAALMNACWAKAPAERPSFAQVLAALDLLAAEELPRWLATQRGKVADTPAVLVDAMAVDQDDSAATSTAAPAPTGTAGPQQVLPPFAVCPIDLAADAAAAAAVAAGATPSCVAAWEQLAAGAAGSPGGQQLPTQQPLGQLLAHQGAVHPGSSQVEFNAGLFEAIGPRDTMEDKTVVLPDLWGRHHVAHPQQHPQQQQQQQQGQAQAQEGQVLPSAAAAARAVSPNVPLVPVAAVFDGHRGSEAADFCRARLAATLRAAVQTCASPAAALRQAFMQLEQEYYAHWQHQRQVHAHLQRGAHAFPGTTAVVALLAPPEPASGVPRRLFVANAGDCRAVLVRSRRPLAASRDHTGLLEDERARLAAAGLHVTWQHGGWRIGSTGLQVTRCVGDFDVKGVVGADGHGRPGPEAAAALGSGMGVTAVPEVTAVELQPGADHFLILGSDGLWDVMSVAEAAGLVYDTVKDPVMAAKRLVCEALMRGSADNVTAVVVFLTPVDTLERVFGLEGESFAVTGTAYGSRVRLDKDRHVAATADEIRDTY